MKNFLRWLFTVVTLMGFGLKKLSVADMRSNTFIFLHAKQIKDVKFRPGFENWVMTASQDNTIKITNLNSQSVLQTFTVSKNVWSCCWDQSNTNFLYAGLSNGSMSQYDIRKTSEAVGTFTHESYRCPIVSMNHVPRKLAEGATSGYNWGLLASTLKGVAYWRKVDSVENNFELKPHLFPSSPGSCAGMKYSPELEQVLVSYRPGKAPGSTSLHYLYDVNFFPPKVVNSYDGISYKYVHKFVGGRSHSMLTRNALYTVNDDHFIAYGNETGNLVSIYETKSKKMLQSLTCDQPSLDIMSIKINNNYLLASLTDKNLRLYEYK